MPHHRCLIMWTRTLSVICLVVTLVGPDFSAVALRTPGRTLLGVKTNRSTHFDPPSKCFIKLHKIGKLQGSAKVFNAKKLLGRKRRIGRLPKYYEVESLETIGSCCWKVCMNSRGKCIGRFVPGGTPVDSLSHISIRRVKRVKALKRKNCPQGSLRRNIP